MAKNDTKVKSSIVDDTENMTSWMLEMENQIDSIDKDDMFSEILLIINKLFDEHLTDYTIPLFDLLKKAQKKAEISCESNLSLGMRAYQEKKYLLAELAFIDSNAKNNLAYMIRRGEVEHPSKYTKKTIAELLKEGVHEKEPFSMINMSLLWSLNIGDAEAWDLANHIMSNIPNTNISSAYEWWLEVGKAGDVEGFLVHYWLLKYNKINASPLGPINDIRSYVQSLIKEMPSYI